MRTKAESRNYWGGPSSVGISHWSCSIAHISRSHLGCRLPTDTSHMKTAITREEYYGGKS